MEHSHIERAQHEIRHGEILAASEPERVWGWATPAGRIRAKRRTRLITEGAQLGPGVRALEIGCGTGLFTEMFAATGAQLLSVDISPHLLALAARRGLPEDRVSPESAVCQNQCDFRTKKGQVPERHCGKSCQEFFRVGTLIP